MTANRSFNPFLTLKNTASKGATPPPAPTAYGLRPRYALPPGTPRAYALRNERRNGALYKNQRTSQHCNMQRFFKGAYREGVVAI